MTGGATWRETARPAVDSWTTDEELEIRADLPGAGRDDVRLTLEQHQLLLEAEPRQPAGELVGERRLPRRYRRLFTLPEFADTERVTARMDDGVLRLTLQKLERARARTIPIEEA